MHIKTMTALAALFAAASLTPAHALSLGLSGGGGASASGGSSGSLSVGLDASLDANLALNASSSTSTTASLAATGAASAGATAAGNIDFVTNLIESSDWTTTSFNGMANLSAAVFTVDDAADPNARATFDAALGVYATDVAELQASLAANAQLNTWLTSQGIALDSIVAANVAADGTLELFTD